MTTLAKYTEDIHSDIIFIANISLNIVKDKQQYGNKNTNKQTIMFGRETNGSFNLLAEFSVTHYNNWIKLESDDNIDGFVYIKTNEKINNGKPRQEYLMHLEPVNPAMIRKAITENKNYFCGKARLYNIPNANDKMIEVSYLLTRKQKNVFLSGVEVTMDINLINEWKIMTRKIKESEKELGSC